MDPFLNVKLTPCLPKESEAPVEATKKRRRHTTADGMNDSVLDMADHTDEPEDAKSELSAHSPAAKVTAAVNHKMYLPAS